MASPADNSLSKTYIELPEYIREDFTRLFDHEDLADIYFILGKDKKHRIPGHKIILSVKSDVFKTMFFGSLPIKSDEVEIPDIETTTFLILLNFLYFNEANFNCEQTAISVLYAAHKYYVSELEKHCVEFLKANVDTDNAIYLLTQGRLYDKPELIAKCLDVIDKNTYEILRSRCDGFTNIDLETLIFVLKRDTLQAFESKLFKASVLWAEAECSRKKLDVTPENQWARLFDNEDLADIYFILGKDKKHRIPGHKIILSVKSDVFKTMFFGSLPIKSDEVEIPDIETTTFLILLNFLYFNEAKISCVQTAFSILYAAKKYHVSELEKHCVEFLKENVYIHTDNVIYFLSRGEFYDEPELITKCLDVIDKKINEILLSRNFCNINLETLILVLKRDTLQVFESKLFEAMVLWAKAECSRKKLDVTPENQRFVLGPAINLIRYDLMNRIKFDNGQFLSKLLDCNTVKQFINLPFKSPEKPRCGIKNSEIRLQFKRQTNGIHTLWLKTRFPTQYFKVKKPIIIVGYIIVQAARPNDFDISLRRENKSYKGILQDLTEEPGTISFTFDRPIMLTKDEEFKVKVCFRGRPRAYWRPKNDGVIVYNGVDSEKRMCDYLEWGKSQNESEHVVSEIIFYEY